MKTGSAPFKSGHGDGGVGYSGVSRACRLVIGRYNRAALGLGLTSQLGCLFPQCLSSGSTSKAGILILQSTVFYFFL